MKDMWIEKFINEAVPRILKEIKSAKIIIFGSRVRGEAKDESDIDVIVISDHFRGMPFLKRMPELLKLVKFGKHIDFLCYTREEFERIKKSSSIINSALKEGLFFPPFPESTQLKGGGR